MSDYTDFTKTFTFRERQTNESQKAWFSARGKAQGRAWKKEKKNPSKTRKQAKKKTRRKQKTKRVYKKSRKEPVTRHIREVLSRTAEFSLLAGDPTVISKRIQLNPDVIHRVKRIDFFDDHEILSAPLDIGYSFYLSPWPVAPSGELMTSSFYNTGPAAGEEHILFKATGFVFENIAKAEMVYKTQEFPSEVIAGDNRMNFYSPHLWMTMILDTAETSVTITDLQISLYLEIEEEEVHPVEYQMGIIQEYRTAQFKQLLNEGSLQIATGPEVAGRTFPMWLAGGVRSEFMTAEPRSVEIARTRGVWESTERLARTAVAFDAPFGTDDVPDWVAVNMPGISVGPVRARYPNVDRLTNGNVGMN